ncbi:MAG: TRAP transporter substrate-binding protein [Clostridiales bacterium]|nr:TRAP transporter substrate-binding protein [Clostridiales bacterium]
MSKKTFLTAGLALLMVLTLLAGCGGGTSGNNTAPASTPAQTQTPAQTATETPPATVTTIRAAHVLTPDHPYHLGLEKFGELVSAKTNGALKVEVFHSSQLGNERDLIEGLQLGTVEMCLVSTAPLAGFTSQFEVFDLPFIFSETQKARDILDGPIGQDIMSTLDSQGIVGLCYFENGFRHITNNIRPINTPDDLKGMKIRTMESPIHMASFKAMGSDPTPIAFGEVYTALQQGVVDGQETPYAIIYTSNFFEVQKYLSETGHFYAPAPLLMSKAFFDGLDADTQKAVLEAAIESREYERDVLDEMNKSLVDQLQEAGMTINSVDKQPFIDVAQSVYEEFGDEIGRELIQKIQDAQK